MAVEKVNLEVPKEAEELKIFQVTSQAFGEKKKKDIIKFAFRLAEGVTEDQIDYIYPDCGACTKAIVKGNRIVGTLDLSKAHHNYNPGATPINKYVFVKMNDGKRQFIPNPKTKVRMINKDVNVQRLTISCVVKN